MKPDILRVSKTTYGEPETDTAGRSVRPVKETSTAADGFPEQGFTSVEKVDRSSTYVAASNSGGRAVKPWKPRKRR